MSPNLCVCSELPLVPAQTQVVILAHRVELAKTTNTGRLVARMLGARAELITHDAPAQPGAADDPDATYVLFPGADALPLERVRDRVRTLIVPDGTWAQARRIARRHPRCAARGQVALAAPPPSRYQLRRSNAPSALCTLEAVAYALQQLEGSDSANTLLAAFAAWHERAIRVRQGAHEQRAPCQHTLSAPDLFF